MTRAPARRHLLRGLLFVALLSCVDGPVAAGEDEVEDPTVTVGSKKFTESVIIGEMLTRLAQAGGSRSSHRAELGGTAVLWNALLSGEIDVYPEYTGTLRYELFAGRALEDDVALAEELARSGVRMSRPLGFNNTYALGMKEQLASRLGVESIEDLRKHPHLRLGFSNEFMQRNDGWPGLRDRYRLPHESVRGLDHDLAYRGIASGSLDVTDTYSTDAEIEHYGLRVLNDDAEYFPDYHAVVLYRSDLEQRAPSALRSMLRIEGAISDSDMTVMNALVKLEKNADGDIAHRFLNERLRIGRDVARARRAHPVVETTRQHLMLVGISLLAAILIAIPLGIACARRETLARFVLAIVAVVQTIPSLALLVFMIPLLGIGAPPAIAALFLYSLLPIVRNTYTGLVGISPQILASADAMGLPSSARLRLVELPLAAQSILAGIKTSAVINVGTATLGALIGAGGYGQPILTGIRLDDLSLILQGAVPAAVLALLVQGAFDLAELAVVPKGLRISAT